MTTDAISYKRGAYFLLSLSVILNVSQFNSMQFLSTYSIPDTGYSHVMSLRSSVFSFSSSFSKPLYFSDSQVFLFLFLVASLSKQRDFERKF